LAPLCGVKPQLCTLAAAPPAGDDWLHEIKHDGYRLMCRVHDGRVVLTTRNGFDWTHRLWPLARAAKALPVRQAVLDGELVFLRPDGVSSFNDLLSAMRRGTASQLVFYAFDLLHLDGYDLRRVACLERKDILAQLLHGSQGPICYVDYIQGHGREFFEVCKQRGLEGIVSKRCHSHYTCRRSDNWRKVKCLREAEFVVGGFVPEGRTGIASLLVGQLDDESRLVYVGSVSAGVRAARGLDAVLPAMTQERSGLLRRRSHKIDRATRWVAPLLIATVRYLDWTADGLLRQPVLCGLKAAVDYQDRITGNTATNPTSAKATTSKNARRRRCG
jgi:bifunctional non-homologous end joining protein LigD